MGDIRAIDFRFDWAHAVLSALDASNQAMKPRAGFDGLGMREQWEHTTGVALVTLQVYLGGTSSDVRAMRPSAPKHPQLLRTYGQTIEGMTLKDVEAFWQLANLYKHQDEWLAKTVEKNPNATHADWSHGQKETVVALRALGLHEGVEFPLVDGAGRVLGDGWTCTTLLDRAQAFRKSCLQALGLEW